MRSKGRPAYKRKTKQGSFICTYECWLKLLAAKRRTGKSKSDIIEHCIRAVADSITPETMTIEAQPKEFTEHEHALSA